ncbi:MAG: isochorismatase family cysteine hydrolase [Planctomycetales bacterium]
MRKTSATLHGNVPDTSPVVLLIIDVINDLEFPEGREFLPRALEMAEKIADLKRRCRVEKIPAIYVNDNFGRWRSDFQAQIDHCLEDGVRGRKLVEILHPDEDDYFVLKPKHSGFFATTLETLLRYLQARTLILTGITTDNCVLFTANDAYMRDYRLWVPSDCVAAFRDEDHRNALRQIARVLKADIGSSEELRADMLTEREFAKEKDFHD